MSAITNSIRELEAKRRSIDAAIKTLRALERGVGGSSGRSGSRNMSEEGRRRIAEAQRRRWAKVRAASKKSQ